MKILIIIPTYNECDNIGRLVKEISALNSQLQILIIDDNSPDGTGKIAEQMAQKNSNIYVMHRPKKMGLGSALKDGFKWALAQNFDYIFQMDADFSHNPIDILKILDEAISGTELVIGSRYKDGLRVKDRSIFRTGISYLANLYIRTILGLNIYDATSGFRCFHRSVLKGVDLSKLISKNYAFQVEMTYACYKKECRIKEVPIVFTERKKGNSKFSIGIVIEAFYTVLRLRFFSA